MKKHIFFIVMLLVILPLRAYAINDVTINCNKTKLKANEETSCTLNMNNLDFTVVDIVGKVEVGSNLSITSSSYDNSLWLSLDQVFSVTDINLMRHSNENISKITIATFKVKASDATGTSQIKFTGVKAGNSNYQSVSLNCNPVTISFASKVNTLKSLSVSGVDINFSVDKTTYSVEVDTDSVEINAMPTDSNAKVTGTGKKNLNYGKNELKVVVTAEDGSTKTYTINVNRKDNRSDNNNLKSLSSSSGNISFNKNTTNYTLKVSSGVTKIKVNATLEDSKASFVDGFGPREVNLNYGTNAVLIKVKSEKGTEKVYTINISREDNRSSNTNLKSITLSSGSFQFDKNIYEYIVRVPYESEKVSLDAVAEDVKSKVEITKVDKLVVGENIFTIKVTAENGNTKEYKVTVIREEKVEVTINNEIENLEIEGYEISFDKDKYDYVIETNEKQLNIKVTLANDKATYRIDGNKNLKDGSIINIVVTDEVGNSNIYKINIKNIDKDMGLNDNTNVTLFILLIISLILNILTSVSLLFKVLKQNREKNMR